MNMSVEEERLISRVDHLEKQLTHVLMKIELISGFLKKKFKDASFPIKMLGAVMLKRVHLDGRKVRNTSSRKFRKAKGTTRIGNSGEARTTIKVKSPPARNVDVSHNNSLEIPIMEDKIQTQTSTSDELLNGTSANADGSNTNSFGVTNYDSHETVEMQSTVTIKNFTGEAPNTSKVQIAKLKKTLSVRLERMDVAPKDSLLSKRGASNKSKAKASNFQQQTCPASKIEEKRFKCSWKDCPRRFAWRLKLERHWRVHTGEKPFKCTWAHCKRCFNQRVHLTYHLRTHTGEKPFKCTWPDCGKSFTQAGHLIMHRRTHTGEKPYSCELCGKRFSQSGLLNAHMMIHTGEKPFKCDVCGAEYRCQTTFCHHKKRHNLI